MTRVLEDSGQPHEGDSTRPATGSGEP